MDKGHTSVKRHNQILFDNVLLPCLAEKQNETLSTYSYRFPPVGGSDNQNQHSMHAPLLRLLHSAAIKKQPRPTASYRISAVNSLNNCAKWNELCIGYLEVETQFNWPTLIPTIFLIKVNIV